MSDSMSAPAESKGRSPARRRRWRVLLGAGVALPAAILALWFAVHRFAWVGPLLADSLRAVIGVDAVTKLEDFAYGIEDRWNRYSRRDEKPKAYWEVPSNEPGGAAPARSAAKAQADGPPPLPPFRPQDVGPVHKSWSAPGDGQWVPIHDPRRPDDGPHLFKTLLHPDANRSWAELFVVAVDLRRVKLHLVAGYQEPKSEEPEGIAYQERRTARIAPQHHKLLLAAFNGSFKLEHGRYGMKIDGVTLVKPRKHACTVAMYRDETIRVRSWPELEPTEAEMLWYRQAPRCMVEAGKMHPGLVDPEVRSWGATLDGETVIRRSAIGISKNREVLYAGITNHTTAKAIALGMAHAGAQNVAQLDVNWSYPKFVLYEPSPEDGRLLAVALAEGFEFSEDEYIRQRARRDFFYLTRKVPAPQTARR